MARPIEATPVLRGEDARRFVAAAQSPQPYTPPTFDMKKIHAAVQAAMRKNGKK